MRETRTSGSVGAPGGQPPGATRRSGRTGRDRTRFYRSARGSHLEARACVANGRGNGALRKLGAVQEGVLRRSFLKNGQFLDQMLWSILADEWRQAKAVWAPGLVH